MTAKELKEYHKRGRGNLLSPTIYCFDRYALMQFAEQLCKEQREICANVLIERGAIGKHENKINAILNAKMPEL